MNWIAFFWVWVVVGWTWLFFDGIDYEGWVNKDYHKAQRNRLYIIFLLTSLATAILTGLQVK